VADQIDELRRLASNAALPPQVMQPYLEKVRAGAFAVTPVGLNVGKHQP
jgi:hypothetical protein